MVNILIWSLIISCCLQLTPVSSYYFSCVSDECLCCIRDNHTSLFAEIPKYARLLIDMTHLLQTSAIHYLDTKLKQIETETKVLFRTCSKPNAFEETSLSEYVPWFQEMVVPNLTNSIGLDNCLQHFCLDRTLYLNMTFKCISKHIRSLDVGYVNRTCFSVIKYVHIESPNLETIGNGGIFADDRIHWAIIHMVLETFNLKRVSIYCNAFQSLLKLRTLRFNMAYLPNFQCVFRSNPNLVKIVWNTTQIWNMCNGTFDIWANGQYYDESSFNATFLSYKTNRIGHYFVISLIISLLLMLVTILKWDELKRKFGLCFWNSNRPDENNFIFDL